MCSSWIHTVRLALAKNRPSVLVLLYLRKAWTRAHHVFTKRGGPVLTWADPNLATELGLTWTCSAFACTALLDEAAGPIAVS